MLTLSLAGHFDESRALINGRIKAGTDKMGDQFRDLVALNKQDAVTASSVAGKRYEAAVWTVIAVAVLACLLTLVLAVWLTRSIVTLWPVLYRWPTALPRVT